MGGKTSKEGAAVANPVQCSFQRVEKKYILTPAQYEQILRGIGPHMQADRFAGYTICNLYYDTDDYRLIRASLEKPVYKEKLRMRSYGVPGDGDRVFVELKKKFDGVVYKRREVMEAEEAVRYLSGGPAQPRDSQIFREIDFFLRSYHPTPKVFISYDREAYAGTELPDLRLTFDTNLRGRETELDLRCGNYGAPILGPEQILMEVKIPGAAPVWLSHLLSETGAFPTSFSKYGAYYQQHILGHTVPDHIKKEARVCA
jgi:hypothetical protein